MNTPRNPRITSRKQPQQARSNELVTAILEAALQVLAREGAQRFTTTRVAERAGVSVGSIYQYFPNKAAILFRLQSDEWQHTNEMLRNILEDRRHSPAQRLRELVEAFVQTECEEAAIRTGLNDAAPLYRNSPEARAARANSELIMHRFVREAWPAVPLEHCQRAADLITHTLSANGKRISELDISPEEIADRCAMLADMLCAYMAAGPAAMQNFA